MVTVMETLNNDLTKPLYNCYIEKIEEEKFKGFGIDIKKGV